MDFLTSNSMLLMEKSMDFLWTKQAAILDNMANVETPNYKAKVVTFEESIRDKLRAAAESAGSKDKRGRGVKQSVREVIEGSDMYVFETKEAKRMDDNNVDTTEQMVEMVRNAYQQQYVYNAINKSYAILRMAVRGQ